MVNEKRRAYMKAYRERGGAEYKKSQTIAQQKHRLKYPEKRKQTSQRYYHKKRQLIDRLQNFEKMIFNLVINTRDLSLLQTQLQTQQQEQQQEQEQPCPTVTPIQPV